MLNLDRKMNRHSTLLCLCGLSMALLLSACSPKPEVPEISPKESIDPSDDLKAKIQAKEIKRFPSSDNDAHDITLLNSYQSNFDQVSQALDDDLQNLAVQGNLSAEMSNHRKRDLIQSSLNMLKDLDLKTAQGRYIQGLLYQYWENQANVYDELGQSANNELQNPTDAVEGMGDYYTALAQLQHWQTTLP